MSDSVQYLTPVGRLVQGSPFEGRNQDAEGRPLLIKNGPNAGQPRTEYYMALAIPKTEPEMNNFFSLIQGVAQAAFPQGQFNAPTFAWKVIDGDGVDQNGNSNSAKEGFAGNWVLKISGGYPPQCYSRGGGQLLTDPNAIKRGYYARVYLNIRGNNSTQRPGIYLNPSMVELIGYGDEITSGPDAGSVFGGAPVAQLPAGASETPPAPQGQMAMPGAQQAAPAAGGFPGAQQAAPAAGGFPGAQQAAPQGQAPAAGGFPGAQQAAPQGQAPAAGGFPGAQPEAPAGVPAGTQPHPAFLGGQQ